MRDALGCDEEDTGLHRQLVAFEQEEPRAGHDLIDLVHPGVRVQRVLLAGLEAVESDEDALGRKQRPLAHLLGVEDSVLFGAPVIYWLAFWMGN